MSRIDCAEKPVKRERFGLGGAGPHGDRQIEAWPSSEVGLRILSDGVILKSETNLVASKTAIRGAKTAILCATIAEKLGAALHPAD